MEGLPPLSLSSGPAMAGGPTSSGGSSTGDFYHNRESWPQTLARALPLAIVAGVVLWLVARK